MTSRADIAYTLADGSIPPWQLPEQMHLWWGEYEGAPLGLMTDSTSGTPEGGDPATFARLGRAAAVVKCLADERLWPAAPASSPDLQVAADELLEATWGTASILVDGESIAADTAVYQGIEFVVGKAASPAPFVMARPVTAVAMPWPQLATVGH